MVVPAVWASCLSIQGQSSAAQPATPAYNRLLHLLLLPPVDLLLRQTAYCHVSTTNHQDQLQPLGPAEVNRQHVILLRTNISLLPASSNGSIQQQQQQQGSSARAVPPGGVPVPYPVSLLSDVSTHGSSELDLGFRRELLAVPANAEDAQLQVWPNLFPKLYISTG
jgi:hypothetical protein